MQKVVIDTNVVISALLSKDGSYSREIIKKVLDNSIAPLMGEALFNEYIDVTNRQALFNKCILNKNERQEFLQAFMSCCLWQKIYFKWRPNLQDEADNHIIELAIAGGANYIITQNIKDLKSGELLFERLRIVTPEHFIKEQPWEQ